ncbi:hypothetical protein D3C81_1803020 [compost metagenome]
MRLTIPHRAFMLSMFCGKLRQCSSTSEPWAMSSMNASSVPTPMALDCSTTFTSAGKCSVSMVGEKSTRPLRFASSLRMPGGIFVVASG